MDEGAIFNGCSSLSSLCEWSYQEMQTEYLIPPTIYQCFILPLIKATTTRIKDWANQRFSNRFRAQA